MAHSTPEHEHYEPTHECCRGEFNIDVWTKFAALASALENFNDAAPTHSDKLVVERLVQLWVRQANSDDASHDTSLQRLGIGSTNAFEYLHKCGPH